MSNDLSRLFKRAVLKTVINEGVPAKLGKADGSTLFYVDDAGTHHKDRVWARIGAGTAPAEAVVRCVSVPQTLNLPVIVADRDGVLTVIRTDMNRAVEWADGQLIDVAPHNWTHDRYGSDALYITGLSFLPLAAYPSDPPDLTVEVEQCFYRYQNTHKVFERTTSDSLSAYRPAGTVVTHYVILALDRSTNALAVIDGDDVSGGNRVLPSASTVLATAGLRSEHFPICAIRLYNAQTQIMPRDIFMDLRLWAGESSASGSGSSGSAAVRGPNTSTDHAIARWDGTDGTLLQDSYPTIDDSGNVDLAGHELRDYSHQMIEADTGAAYEIDWSAAGIFELTLTDDPTFTFVNESAGRAVTLILIQDGVGGRTVTWPGAVEWPNDVEPILFSGVGDADTITLICRNDGSTVSGFATSDVRTNQGNTFTVGDQIIQTDPDTVTAFQVFDADGGNPVLSVDTINERVGIGVAAPGAQLQIDASGPTVIGQIIKLAAGQSKNGFEVQNSGGTILTRVYYNGRIEVSTTLNTAGQRGIQADLDVEANSVVGLEGDIACKGDYSDVIGFSGLLKMRNANNTKVGTQAPVALRANVQSTITAGLTHSELAAFKAVARIANTNTVTDLKMAWILDPVLATGGAITTLYGLRVEDLTAATTNYAIYTNLGDVRFGDTVTTAAGRIKSTTRIDDGDSPYTTLNVDDVLFCDTDGGVITVNLQAGVEGRRLRIINCGTSGNALTVEGDGAETVWGQANVALNDGDKIIIVYNATEGWY